MKTIVVVNETSVLLTTILHEEPSRNSEAVLDGENPSGFKRFHLKSKRKTKVDWGGVSLAHNLRKRVASYLYNSLRD